MCREPHRFCDPFVSLTPPPCLVISWKCQANLHGGQEEKTPGACVWSPPGSPSRHRGGGAVAGGFQRRPARLEEALAEVSAEAAASPQIVTDTSGPRGNPAENTQQPQRHRGEQVPFPGATEGSGKCDPGGGIGGGWSGGRQWTASKDRALARLVRECEFDFDLVAARFSSAIASGDGGGEGDISLLSVVVVVVWVVYCS